MERRKSTHTRQVQNVSDTRLLVKVLHLEHVVSESSIPCCQKAIIAKIRALPGNNRCADCGAADPEWLSVNLGILICIHCSGRHREMSVQYSRIRSLKLDQLKTHELLVSFHGAFFTSCP